GARRLPGAARRRRRRHGRGAHPAEGRRRAQLRRDRGPLAVSRARDALFAAAQFLFGAMWLFAAGAKLASPLVPYEFLARAVAPGPAAKAALVASIVGETLLGAAVVLRPVRAGARFPLSLPGLGLA